MIDPLTISFFVPGVPAFFVERKSLNENYIN